jgi:hypothetical protein
MSFSKKLNNTTPWFMIVTSKNTYIISNHKIKKFTIWAKVWWQCYQTSILWCVMHLQKNKQLPRAHNLHVFNNEEEDIVVAKWTWTFMHEYIIHNIDALVAITWITIKTLGIQNKMFLIETLNNFGFDLTFGSILMYNSWA